MGGVLAEGGPATGLRLLRKRSPVNQADPIAGLRPALANPLKASAANNLRYQ